MDKDISYNLSAAPGRRILGSNVQPSAHLRLVSPKIGHFYILLVDSVQKTRHMLNGFAPLVTVLVRIGAEGPFDDGGPLKASKHECKRLGPLRLQHLTSTDGKVVQRVGHWAGLLLGLVADQRTIFSQKEIPCPPILNVFTCKVRTMD